MQSTEASNKIEGIVNTKTSVQQLWPKTTPRNRDEEEIQAYWDVLNTIHESYAHTPSRSSIFCNCTGICTSTRNEVLAVTSKAHRTILMYASVVHITDSQRDVRSD